METTQKYGQEQVITLPLVTSMFSLGLFLFQALAPSFTQHLNIDPHSF